MTSNIHESHNFIDTIPGHKYLYCCCEHTQTRPFFTMPSALKLNDDMLSLRHKDINISHLICTVASAGKVLYKECRFEYGL